MRVVLGIAGMNMVEDVARSSLLGPNTAGDADWSGILIGFQLKIVGPFWLGGFAAHHRANAGAAVDAGYQLTRNELGLAPHLDVFAIPFRQVPVTRFQVYLAAPFGLSFDDRTPPPRRAFDETIDNDRGWFVGGVVGVRYVERHWGGLLEIGPRRTVGSERTTITPHDASMPVLFQQRRYVDIQTTFTVAAVYTF